jgi:hypothetical protein
MQHSRFGFPRYSVLVVVLAGLITQSSRAEPLFEFLHQERWVRAQVLLNEATDSDFDEATGFGAFAGNSTAALIIHGEDQPFLRDSHAIARQTSSLDHGLNATNIAFLMSLGTFASDPIGPPPDAFAESLFDIRFRLNIAHYFDRTLFQRFGPGDHEGGLFLSDGVTPFDPAWSEFAIGHVGLLPRGEYVLRHHLSTGPDNDPELELQLELIPVPLPAALWMALSLLMMLVLVGRGRKVLARLAEQWR